MSSSIPVRVIRPCINYFKSDNGLDENGEPFCKDGKKCRFSHNEEIQMKFYKLKKCPKCSKKCKETSKQCGKCTEEWLKLKAEEKERAEAEKNKKETEEKEKSDVEEKGDDTEDEKTVPCFNHFKSDDGFNDEGFPLCTYGKYCKFSHDHDLYMEYYGLKWCKFCNNKCKKTSKQCGACTEDFIKKKAEIDSRPDQQCRGGMKRNLDDGSLYGKGWKCENKTKFDLCKECYTVTMKHKKSFKY